MPGAAQGRRADRAGGRVEAELGAALRADARVLVVASALGSPQERLERVTPTEAAARDWGTAVSVVLCLDESRALGAVRTVAGPSAGPARWALDEGEFTHRDSMITKFEVRALALARLGPRLGDLVWDIGAGSGSVAVECARFGAAVTAVEKTLDGVGRIRANAAAHGVDVRVVHGAAPTVLSDLDDPDAVFVGGGGANCPPSSRRARGGRGGRSSSRWPRSTGYRPRARRSPAPGSTATGCCCSRRGSHRCRGT